MLVHTMRTLQQEQEALHQAHERVHAGIEGHMPLSLPLGLLRLGPPGDDDDRRGSLGVEIENGRGREHQ